ncbi:MarR family transcriptional regulator [Mycolicibacterium sp. HK-90]|nr:MarR family transcriptional regulator [Mycolicibacterium sp. HK-90]WKG06722.1 MarR family transcriptional regulator [Mycolicibacterium sp. HK-90]
MRMTDLAQAFDLAPSRVTQQIDRLEAQGLARRIPSPTDRRVVLAAVSDSTSARLERAIACYAKEIRDCYLGPLSREQMISLGDSCRRITTPASVIDVQPNWESGAFGQPVRRSKIAH